MNEKIANDLIRYADLVEDAALISPEEMNCASLMRLAAEALAQPEQKPVSWKLVPVQPTEEMLKAMDECSTEGYDERLYAGHAASVYMAAVDAAPASPQQCYCGDITRLGVVHRADSFCDEKPEQEPVAWVNHGENRITRATGWDGYGALYTKQQQRKPLTDEQILKILCIHLDEGDDIEDWRHEINEARAIEAAHGIKE